MKVVNLFAGPGVGKSATAKLLAGMLAIKGYRVELVEEFAKFMTYARNSAALQDQDYMFAKQHHRLSVLRNTKDLDFVVMDGPLPIALLFGGAHLDEEYLALLLKRFHSFDNVNYFLLRNTTLPYQTWGRGESLEEAMNLCARLKSLLALHNIQTRERLVDNNLAGSIFTELTGEPPPLVPAP